MLKISRAGVDVICDHCGLEISGALGRLLETVQGAQTMAKDLGFIRAEDGKTYSCEICRLAGANS